MLAEVALTSPIDGTVDPPEELITELASIVKFSTGEPVVKITLKLLVAMPVLVKLNVFVLFYLKINEK